MDRRNLPLQRSCSTNSEREETTNQANVLPEGSVRVRRQTERYDDSNYRGHDGRRGAISTDSDSRSSFHNEG
jgi:hypothetical protein